MSSKKINIVVAGATGYVGLDLVKILSDIITLDVSYNNISKNTGIIE